MHPAAATLTLTIIKDVRRLRTNVDFMRNLLFKYE